MFSVRNLGLVSCLKRNSLGIVFESIPINALSNSRKLKYLFIYNAHHIFREKIHKEMHYPLNSPLYHRFCGKSA